MKLTGVLLALGLAFLNTSLAFASYEAGQAALSRSNAVTAVDEWLAVAKRGDSRAQLALGQLLEKGAEGIVADPVDALSWYRLAAAQGLTEASEAADRLSGQLGVGEVEEAHLRSLATVGLWFRDFTGQDESAYQQMRAVAAAERQPSPRVEIGSPDTLADQRAATQRDLIAHRKAEEEAQARAIEESRQAAIEAARMQAEEAKQQAALREQQITAQRQAIAEREATPTNDELEATRARLAALMAKQGGASGAVTGAGGAAAKASNLPDSGSTGSAASSSASSILQNSDQPPVPQTNTATKATEEPGGKVEEMLKAVPASPEILKESKPLSKPEAGIGTNASSTPKAVPVPPVKSMTEPQQIARSSSNETAISLSAVTEEKSASLALLESYDGLDQNAVAQIFEQAKIADLGTPAAQQEIENSLTRIEALKWSLISGAKGDKAAPKMNKVLMSRMTPVQIAEANRLASEWLIKEQRNL